MRKFLFVVLLLLVPSAVFAQNVDRDRRDDWRNRRYRSNQNTPDLSLFGGYRWGVQRKRALLKREGVQ